MFQKNDDYSRDENEGREGVENKQDDPAITADDDGDKEINITEGSDSGEANTPDDVSEQEAKDEVEVESDRFLRLAAEFDNYKKRTAREFGEVVRRANERLLRSLVEIVDNFERARSHDGDENGGDAYRKGVDLIYNQLADILKKEQVTVIEAIGQPFDPNYHEAMMQSESDEYDEGIVCLEIQKGYKIDDKVLRHARVGVSKGAPESKKE